MDGVLHKANAKINDSRNDIEVNGMKRTEIENRLNILENDTQKVSCKEEFTKTFMKHRNNMYKDKYLRILHDLTS